MVKSPDENTNRLAQATVLWKQRQDEDYASAKDRLQALHQVVQEEIASQFANALNQELASRPHDTLPEKQNLARWANSELRSLELAIRCPKTGQPSMLFADRGHDPSKGRFQIELLSRSAGRHRVSSSRLLSLELMPHPGRREALAEHWANILNKNQNRGRRR